MHAVSPFETAGFQVGDVITAVDGQPVNIPSEMIFRMSVAGLGNQSAVTRVRDGVTDTVDVALMAAPDMPARAATTLGERDVLTGLQLALINPAVISEMNLPLNAKGVVVTNPGPLGARVGLQHGDVILGIYDQAVGHPDDVVNILRAASRAVSLVVLRDTRTIQLRFRL